MRVRSPRPDVTEASVRLGARRTEEARLMPAEWSVFDASARRAMHAARTHCPIEWPNGLRCLSCNVAFPCHAYMWASNLLADAGWSDQQIKALDVRSGPWS